MEYYYHVPYEFSRPPARRAPSPVWIGYSPLRYDYVGVANGVLYLAFLPPATAGVWLAPMIPRRNLNDASAVTTRHNVPFEPSGHLQGGIREDDTWLLNTPPEASSTAGNGLRERLVSEFLKSRTTSSEISSGGDEEICVVCQDELGADGITAALDCRHRYHVECIKTWLTLKNCCPICRAEALNTVDP
ncbi:hypothetical protein F511_28160 [Dorcoceras hygrometricum]|uniref:RING-type E3 ubiquitin transferase n=1 Tax=Dorcoceras hygrometricum TaxID=472368 RepID=A0A2Z7BYZ4_9LAMI|nr:hypothetical protein F511_28160 [Dorcoceras hygrometricum]